MVAILLKMDVKYTSREIIYKGRLIQAYQIGEGEKVILSLPSFPHSGLYYTFFLKDYDLTKVKFLTFDLPGWAGHSQSFYSPDLALIDFYADIAQAVLDAYSIKEFSLIGYSFGAAISIKLISNRKDQVKKVALVSGIYEPLLLRKEKLFWEVWLLFKLKLSSVLKGKVMQRFKKYRVKLQGQIEENVLEEYNQMLLRADKNVILNSLYQLFTQNVEHNIEILKSLNNVLIVSSTDEDRLFRKQSEWLRRHLSNDTNYKIHGRHEDLILNPKAEVVKKIISYLLDY